MLRVHELKALEKAYAESKLREYRIKIRHARAEVKTMFAGWKRLANVPQQAA